MIKSRVFRLTSLMLFIASALFWTVGCQLSLNEKAPICGPPGAVAQAKCFYDLQVEQIIGGGVIRVKVPRKVIEHIAMHSARTNLGGTVGFNMQSETYGDFVYEIKVDNTDGLKERVTYEFESIPGETTMKFKGDARFPDEHPKDFKPRASASTETQLLARHTPQCCMCGTCQSNCVCPGEGGCPWCVTADVQTMLARASVHDNPLDIRKRRGVHASNTVSNGVAERFLALMSGSPVARNIAVQLIASYNYDTKFVPSCWMKNA